MTPASRTVERYLERHGEPEAGAAAVPQRRYRHALVIPAYDETPEFLDRVTSRCDADVLTILVVNAPDDAPATAAANTRELLRAASAREERGLLLVDRVTRPTPRRQGVGLARKIGADIALALYARGAIEDPWLRQTDADAVLPAHYFSAPLPTRGAAVFAHRHVAASPRLQRAADLYDLHMRYYVEGLRAAGSHYAYPTLGSTIAVHAEDYAAVRGFPRRNAGEDFYLLNKVAKLGGVVCVALEIELAARVSARVPFGTGPALAKVLASLDAHAAGASYTSYSWASFELLGTTLAELAAFAADPHASSAHQPFTPPGGEILERLGFARVAEQLARQYTPGERRARAVRDWFDALKTLRFVHEARAHHPDVPLLASVAALPRQVRQRLRAG